MVTMMRVSIALQPVATALFANSPFDNGEPSGYLSWRSHVWQRTDPARRAHRLTLPPLRQSGAAKVLCILASTWAGQRALQESAGRFARLTPAGAHAFRSSTVFRLQEANPDLFPKMALTLESLR